MKAEAPIATVRSKILAKIQMSVLSNNLQIQDKKKMADLVRLHRSAATVVYARYKTHLILQNNPQKREELTLSGEGVPRHCFSMNRTEQYEHSLPGVLCIPAYVIIGFPKTGSTSLWNYMSQHPQIPYYKRTHYFTAKSLCKNKLLMLLFAWLSANFSV